MSATGTFAGIGWLAVLLLVSAVAGHEAPSSGVAGNRAKPCPVAAAASADRHSAPEGCRVAKAAPVLLQTGTEHRRPGAAGGEPALLQAAGERHSGQTDVDGCSICPGSPYKGSTIEIVNNCGYTVNVHTDAGVGGKCSWDGVKVPSCLRDLKAGGHVTVNLKEGKGIYSFQIGEFGKSTRFEIAVWNDTWSSPSGKVTDSWDISYNAGFDIGMSVTLPAGGFMPEIVATHATSPAAYQLGGDGCQVQPCSSPTWNGPPGRYELYLCNRPGDVDTPGPCGCKPCPGIECDPSGGGQVCTTSGGGIYCQVGGTNCPLACHGVPTLSGTGDCLSKCPSSEAAVPMPGLQKEFQAVDGGVDRACRGATATDNSELYYTHSWAASLDACKARCANLTRCMGVEYGAGSGRCEVWTRAEGVMASAPVPGFTCLRYVPVVQATTTPPGADAFTPADGGADRACRGANDHDDSASYYARHSVATLDECKALCLKEPACQGVELGLYGRCEVWTRPEGIAATRQVAGYTCLRRQGAPTMAPTPAPTEAPAPAPSGQCHTAVQGEECYGHVKWAMEWGIASNPDWYPGLSKSSTFEEFQQVLHASGSHSDVCAKPCGINDAMDAPTNPVHKLRPAALSPPEWTVVSYNVWWWGAPGGNYKQQLGMHSMLRKFGEQRVSLLGVQECDGGWAELKRLAGPSLDYLQQFSGTQQLCGSYDPSVFEALADGVVYVWKFRHLQWVRLRERATGRTLVFVNVHWHHTGGSVVKVMEASNTRQAIMDHAEPGDIVIVTGDFNVFDDTLKAEMNSNFMSLGLRPLGKGTVFGGIDYIWSSHEPKDSSSCQKMIDEPHGSDHDPVFCRLRATASSYDDRGSTPLDGPWSWRAF